MNPQEEFLANLSRITGRSVSHLTRAVGAGQALLLVDVSGSMGGVKLDQAKAGAKGFAREAVELGYQVGLISFGSEAVEVLEPTDNVEEVGAAAQGLTITGSTNMTAAFRKALDRLLKHDGSRAICVVTDGAPDNRETVLVAAEEAKKASIHISVIGTDGAILEFLKKLVSDQENAKLVPQKALSAAITDVARMLPPASSGLVRSRKS